MKKNSNVLARDKYEDQRKEVYIAEAYLTAIFWNNPEQYDFYPVETMNSQVFLNPIWAFYFGLGREMNGKQITIFDDISTIKTVTETGLTKEFEKYGEYETIHEVMQEVQGREENLEAYYSELKKYRMLVDLTELFGKKVLDASGKYDYHNMSKEQLYTFWFDKVNNLGLNSDANFEVHYLLEGLDKDIDDWDTKPDIGLDFYKSKLMTKICTGWDYGNLYIYGGFGGSGKTSFTFNKVIMSCIENQEKLLIVANEQGIKEFKKLLIATALGIKKDYMRRQRMNEGNFTDEEKQKMKNAIEWVKAFAKDQDKLIALVFMEDYIIRDVKKIVRRFHNRGYRSVLIDTGKPSDGAAEKARWEAFTDDFKELYKMCRPNGGGLNLRMWVNVQLADTALNRRFLNEHAFGESKKIKNEASVVFMGRNVWDDEYEGGKNEIKVHKWIPANSKEANPFEQENEHGYVKEEFVLQRTYTDDKGNEHPNQYYLIFTPKNRRGQDNKNGQPVLVMQANLNNNTWYEVGQCYIQDDKNY